MFLRQKLIVYYFPCYIICKTYIFHLPGRVIDQLYTKRPDECYERWPYTKNDEQSSKNNSIPWAICQTSQQCQVRELI